MKITKRLERLSHKRTFFRETLDSNYIICLTIASELAGKNLHEILAINLTLATKNPKKKGFRKFVFNSYCDLFMNNHQVEITPKQSYALENLGLKLGDNFWLKVETPLL